MNGRSLIIKKLYKYLLTLLILLVTSCSSPTRQIDALNCNDYYLYSIGIGQATYFIKNKSLSWNKSGEEH